ncbi:MAG: hypothetical protein ACE5HX_05355 [bacterium]
MKEYMDSIRRRVCSMCNNHLVSYFLGDNREIMRCGLPVDKICAIERYLPKIVNVVESVDSPRIEDYIIKLRYQVCSKCENLENGYCPRWLNGECALDRNFMLVVEAIKDVRAHSGQIAN